MNECSIILISFLSIYIPEQPKILRAHCNENVVVFPVVDMNDNPPVFEQQAQRCVITEDASRGHFVTLVSASDEDVSDVDKLTYSIVDGNDMQAFVIEPTTGKLYFPYNHWQKTNVYACMVSEYCIRLYVVIIFPCFLNIVPLYYCKN